MTSSAPTELGTWSNWHSADQPLRLGVSTCLLGEKVRFDSGHARSSFVTDTLGEWFEFLAVCPEVEIGMGVPRPTIRLVAGEEGARLVASSSGEDFSERMTTFAESRVAGLMKQGLDGYVVKKGSPSCGLERIEVFRENGLPAGREATGVFTAELIERWPGLPVEDEERLVDPDRRENFIERVFCRNRWRALVGAGVTRRRLVEFHTAHELLIRAHDEAACSRLGDLVSNPDKSSDHELVGAYEAEFQGALRSHATRKKHVSVLQHAIGYLETVLGPDEKRKVLTAIENYRLGLLPLIVPLTLLRYNISCLDVAYLAGQLYFDPHPKELMLRNHV